MTTHTKEPFPGQWEHLPVNYATEANLTVTVQDLDEMVDSIITAMIAAVAQPGTDTEMMPSELARYIRRLVQLPRRLEAGGYDRPWYLTLARVLDLIERDAKAGDAESTEQVRSAILRSRDETYEYASGMRP